MIRLTAMKLTLLLTGWYDPPDCNETNSTPDRVVCVCLTAVKLTLLLTGWYDPPDCSETNTTPLGSVT